MRRKEKRVFIHKDHPYYSMSSNGRTSEARLMMATKLGRPLTRREIVHHIDNNAMNNSLDNLMIMTYQQHLWITRRDTIIKTLFTMSQREKQLEKELKVVNKRIEELWRI